MDKLYRSGFAFLRDCGDGVIEFENKFTGLCVRYSVKSGTTVPGEAVI